MQRAALRRCLRFAAGALASLAGFIVLCALLAPLAFRGPRLAWAVERLLPPLRGEVRLGGGELGAGALFAAVLGLPVKVHLRDLAVFDPEGVEVFWSADLRAAIVLERRPFRLVIHDLRPGVSRWRMARMRQVQGLGFAAAFGRPRRAGPTLPPAAPLVPPAPVQQPRQPERPRDPAQTGPPRFQVAIASAHLDGLSATFDFPAWGLELKDIRAEGSLWAAFPSGGKPPLGFEVRGIDSRGGGSLRILRGAYGNRVPFDRARLDWIGTPNHSPADLLLLVAGAQTGESRLSGRAVFAGLFGGRRSGARGGMEIDADWERAGEALTAIAADRGLRNLKVDGTEARLRARVRVANRELDTRFEVSGLDVSYAGSRLLDLGVRLELQGPPVRLKLDELSFRSPSGGSVEAAGALEASGSARFRLRLDRLATRGLLPPSLRPLLAGTAQGWIAARGDLPRTTRASFLRDGRFVLEGMDLTLARERRGPLPRTLRLFVGKAAGLASASDPDALLGSLEGVRYERGTLTVRGAGVRLAGAQLTGSATLQTRDQAGSALAAPRVRASLVANRVDLARALPGVGLRGSLTLSAQATGALDDLDARIRFPQPANLTVFDQTYGLPAQIDLTLRGDRLDLARFTVTPPGGGRLVAGGRLVFDQEVDFTVEVDRHRLEHLPRISRRLSGASGALSGKMRLQGRPGHAALTGDVALEATNLPVDELVPPLRPEDRIGPRPESGLRVEGGFHLVVERRKPFELAAEVRSFDLHYGCTGPSDPSAGGCLRFANAGPVRFHSRGGLQRLELLQSRLRARDSEFSVAGRLTDGKLDARLDGRFGVGLFEPLYRRWPLVLSGALEASLEARGSIRAPRVRGTLRVVEPVVVRGRSSVAVATSDQPNVPAGGLLSRLDMSLTEGLLSLDEGRLRGSGLQLQGHGIRLRLAGEAPAGPGADRTRPIDLSVEGEIDTAAMARSFPEAVKEASGTLRLAARVAGTLADPVLDGHLEFGSLTARVRRHDVQVRVHPHRLELRQNRLQVAGLTIDTSPGGRLILGPEGRPGTVQIQKLVPFFLGEVRLPAVGRGLHVNLPWLTLEDGSFDITLEGNAGSGGSLRLGGRAEIGAGRYRPRSQPRQAATNATARVTRRLPRSMRPASLPVLLDLQLVSSAEHFVIDPGWLPDLHYGLDVRVGGTASRPRVIWDAAPRGIYSRLVLLLYRLFS